MYATDELPDVPRLARPACRRCGGANLASIEQTVSWRPVNFVYDPHPTPINAEARKAAAANGHPYGPDPAPGWFRGDDWGDDTGNEDSDSIGVVCLDCYLQATGDDAERLVITTRGAFERRHPSREWWVIVERYATTPGGDREQARRRASGRTANEAREAASQSGMVAGRYPFIALRPAGFAISEPDAFCWPVGTKRPAVPAHLARVHA